MNDDDARLREHFAALRRDDALRTPAPAPMLLSGRASIRSRPRAPWLLAATAAGLALVWLGHGTDPPAPEMHESFAVGSWRMPSDVLLELPGGELLESPRWEPVVAPGRGVIAPQSRIQGRSHG